MYRGYKILYIFIISLLFIACSDLKNTDTNTKKAPQMPPLKVNIFVAKSADIPLSFTYPAKITSNANILIVPQVSGTIIKQFFKAGDFVKAGTVLYKIDPKRFIAKLDNAKAMLDVAVAKLNGAKIDYERAKNLQSKNAISQQSYDSAKFNYEIAKANLNSAKSNLDNAKLDLDYTDVRATFSGVLGVSLQDIGSYANAITSNLVRLTSLNPIYATFSIPDTNMQYMDINLANGTWKQIGTNAILHINNKDINGSVEFIDKVINSQTSTVLAKAKFDNFKNEILPGSFATITMNGFIQKDGFLIPKIALRQSKLNTQVYLLKNGKVTPQIVTISYETPTKVVISSGLKNGDMIIMDNFKKIYPGASVSAVKQ